MKIGHNCGDARSTQPYLPQIEIILSLPCIKDVFTAIAIIGEIGCDMAVFLKKCPYFKNRYDQIKKRRGHKKAIIAIAHTDQLLFNRTRISQTGEMGEEVL